MQIYFGKVTEDSMLSLGDWLEFKGESFAYVLEMDEECIRIHDSLGRMVPFSIEDITSLYEVVTVAKLAAEHIALTNSILEGTYSV